MRRRILVAIGLLLVAACDNPNLPPPPPSGGPTVRAITFALHSAGAYAYYYFYYTVGSPDLAERLSANTALSFLGSASTQHTSAGLVGELSGAAMLFNPVAPSVSMLCVSPRHPFSLTPHTAGPRRRR